MSRLAHARGGLWYIGGGALTLTFVIGHSHPLKAHLSSDMVILPGGSTCLRGPLGGWSLSACMRVSALDTSGSVDI